VTIEHAAPGALFLVIFVTMEELSRALGKNKMRVLFFGW